MFKRGKVKSINRLLLFCAFKLELTYRAFKVSETLKNWFYQSHTPREFPWLSEDLNTVDRIVNNPLLYPVHCTGYKYSMVDIQFSSVLKCSKYYVDHRATTYSSVV